MKIIYYAAFALILSFMPQKSEAFVYGTSGSLEFESTTPYTDQTQSELALCVFRVKYHVMWIALWSNHSYVLSNTNCEGDNYYEYPVEQIQQDIAAGDLSITSATVPMTASRVIWGFTGLLLLIPIALFGIWAIRSQNKRSARRAELMAHIPDKVRGPLAFCLQAALSDGTADDGELNAIVKALKEVYRTPMTVPQLRELVENTDMNPDAPEIKTFLTTASGDEKHKALQLLVMVTAADGRLDEKEMKFAVEMGAKLGFTQADVAQVYNAMSGPADDAQV